MYLFILSCRCHSWLNFLHESLLEVSFLGCTVCAIAYVVLIKRAVFIQIYRFYVSLFFSATSWYEKTVYQGCAMK